MRFSFRDWINIGEDTLIYITTSLSRHGGGKISVGSNCRLGVREKSYLAGYAPKTRLVVWGKESRISIGNYCMLNGVSVCSRKSVIIGNDCIFAGGVQILDSDTHLICSKHRLTDLDVPAPVIIGNNVWVGLNAIVLKGTIIGDNSVVGAGAVVKGVFPPNCVIAGNPARIIKSFSFEDSVKH